MLVEWKGSVDSGLILSTSDNGWLQFLPFSYLEMEGSEQLVLLRCEESEESCEARSHRYEATRLLSTSKKLSVNIQQTLHLMLVSSASSVNSLCAALMAVLTDREQLFRSRMMLFQITNHYMLTWNTIHGK
jgi:hypothetical protein